MQNSPLGRGKEKEFRADRREFTSQGRAKLLNNRSILIGMAVMTPVNVFNVPIVLFTFIPTFELILVHKHKKESDTLEVVAFSLALTLEHR